MNPTTREPVSSRASLTAALLVAAVAIAGLLAWQAYTSARSHRAAAEKALRDYAMLAADEFARRTVARLGYSGYYALVTDLRNATAATLPDPAALRASADESTRAAAELPRVIFRYSPQTRRLETSGPPLDAETRAWITRALEEAAAAPPARRPYFTIHSIVSAFRAPSFTERRTPRHLRCSSASTSIPPPSPPATGRAR